MSLIFYIRQKSSLFKTKPDIAMLSKQLGGFAHIGGIDDFYIFRPEAKPPSTAGAEYMLYGSSSSYGRGFYLYIDKTYAEFKLVCPLPTTTHDLEDYFTALGTLAKFLGVREVQHEDGRSAPQAALPTMFAEAKAANFEQLRSTAVAKTDGFTVSGVKMPLFIPAAVCERIAAVPAEAGEKYFAAYLAEKQLGDYYYMKPRFFTNDSGEAIVGYALTEDVPSIIPKRPFIPYGPNPFSVDVPAENWLISFVPQKIEALGTLNYTTFLSRLTDKEKKEFDDNHYLIMGLRLPRMQAILQGDSE